MYRKGLINKGKDVFDMGLDGNLCTHFMYGFVKVTNAFGLESNDPNADHPSGSALQKTLCPKVCGDPNFKANWSDPSGPRCQWPCSPPPSRRFGGFESMNRVMKAKNPSIKTLISVGGWNFNDCAASPSATFGQGSATCEIFSNIASSAANIRLFAQNVITFARNWEFDGFDLDWEYPVVAGHNSNKKPFQDVHKDYANYITMLRLMREEFVAEAATSGKPQLLLTAAVGVGKHTSDTAYDIPRMNQHLDLINLMTYDIHGTWEKRTGCNAPLYATDEDVSFGGASVAWAVDYWMQKGASPQKLTMGIGTYGRGWKLDKLEQRGFNAPASQACNPGPSTAQAGYLAYYEIQELIKKGAQTYYDESRQCPYIVTSGGEWVGYDDVKSVKAKAEFARSRGLRGTMVWALDLDDFAGDYSGDSKYPLISTLIWDPVPTPLSTPAPQTTAAPVPPSTPVPGPMPQPPSTTPAPGPMPQPPAATPTPASSPVPVPTSPGPSPPTQHPAPPASGEVEALVHALEKASGSESVFLYNTGTQWLPSDVYTWPDMIKAVKIMATGGVGSDRFWVGAGNLNYGLVNLAAFLAQCMQETIQYNACDENNWSDQNVVAEAGGSVYSSTSACGQLHQSYQDYTCSAEEDTMAGGKMACDVDPNMEKRATTQAGWYGAPAALFCAPRSKVPKAPRWDYTAPWCAPPGGWDHKPPFSDDVPLDTYFEYVKGGGSCKDYSGIKTGGWTFNGAGCTSGACPGSPAPLFKKPQGRVDVEGCCWWGRGVIQTTGVCNFGKLNYYMGARAAREGRNASYPDVDFCKNPEKICSGGPSELKWVAGFFYWLNAVQKYEKDGWNYKTKLKAWVDGGMNLADTEFINGASGIVNRGCHNPPNCGTGELHGGPARIKNFEKVLKAMGLGG